jgi:phage shock protein PspC (stress-responsive transcriptional regulator)
MCGGIAAYFSIDPIIVRIVFAVFTIVFAVGLLAYLILWIVVPPAHSPIERLNMKGERISAEKVKQVVTEEFKEVEKSFEKLRKDTFESDAFAEVGKGIGNIIKFPVIVRFFVGSLFIALSLFFIAGLLVVLVPPFDLGNYEGIFITGFSQLGELLFNSALIGSILKWALILMFFIPFASVLMFGVSIITGLSFKTSVLRWVSQYLGAISVIVFLLCVVWVYIQFLFLHKQEQKLNFPVAYYSEYVLDIKEEKDSPWLLKGKPIIAFEIANGDTLSAIVQTRAYGRNSVKAAKNNSDIIMNIETSRDTVFIASHWFTETDLWRAQNVKVVVSVPVGRRISMTPRFVDYFFDGAVESGKKLRFRMTASGPKKI